MPQEYNYHFEMDMTSVQNNWFGMQNNFLDMKAFSPFFAKAYEYAF